MAGRILILEEDARLVAALVKALTKQGCEVLVGTDMEAGLAELRTREFDLVLLSIPTGDRPAGEIVKQILADRPDVDIMLTIPGDPSVGSAVGEALRAGASACLPRSTDNASWITAAVDRVMAMRKLRREKEDLRQQLERRATEDPLTGLPNRREFERRLAAEFSRADRIALPLCVILVDIDRFQALLDTYGRELGDRLLVRISDVLQTQLRPYDLRARFEMDEFALILPAMDVTLARSVAERLRKAIERSEIDWQGSRIGCTASLGVSVYGLDNFSGWEAMLEGATDALKRAKLRGRNRTVLFTLARVPGILVVEDQPTDAEFLNALLRAEGFEVKLQNSGGEAVDQIRRGFNGWIFLSLELGDGSGVDTLKRILQIAPGAQIVLLITDQGAQAVPAALALGPAILLRKPFEADQVKRLLAGLMSREVSG